jgi:hypothetical protein
MTRLLLTSIVIVLAGAAQAAAPDFNTDRFCSDFATHAGNMPEMAKAVCLMSEGSTKDVVVAAWDHAPSAGRDACAKSAGDSYVNLAKCLKTLPGQ